MEYKQIQELIKTINKSNIGTLRIKHGEFEIVIKQQGSAETQIVAYQAAPQIATPMPQAVSQAQAPVAAVDAPKADAAPANVVTIKSPMIGTFYRSAGPDKPPFVNVGDEVAPGKVVCIIEAMKLFNEIESEVSGKIVKVLVDDATPVEYDQPLFLVEP